MWLGRFLLRLRILLMVITQDQYSGLGFRGGVLGEGFEVPIVRHVVTH